MWWFSFGFPHKRPTFRNNATVFYLFCHQEIMRALYCLYQGYNLKNLNSFVQPDYNFTVSLRDIYNFYYDYAENPEVKKLPVTDMKLFEYPIEDLPTKIGSWNIYFATDWDTDMQLVRDYVGNDDAMHNDTLFRHADSLRWSVAFHFRKRRPLLACPKPEEYCYHNFILDPLGQTLHVGIMRYPYKPGAKPFIFLRMLIQQIGDCVQYVDLAKGTGINSYHDGVMNADMVRPIQDLKKELIQKLKDMGIGQEYIIDLDKHIEAYMHVGYILRE